ncbi:MAG: hypothetical protein MSG64_00465 [Pyrinomonadaceae bacterium MAG19_C2-C3]|nr:hypothetical protein [Pyrinomonadaceae bacterium MAG19_C2-C3]
MAGTYTALVAESQKRYKATDKGRRRCREYMREYMIAYRQKLKESGKVDEETERRKWREQHRRLREKAIEILGGKQCAKCGCDEYSLLEINHIKGGGQAEQKLKSPRQLCRDIIKANVDRSEYNVLCRVCNALHYVEDILGVKGHQVIWKHRLIG